MPNLLIKRKAYHRKGYTRKDGTRVAAADVPASSYRTEDIGAPGRGKKLIPIKGHMEGYHVSLSERTRHTILAKLVRKYGVATVWRKLNAQVNLRSHSEGEPARASARQVFAADRDWVAGRYGTRGLTPKKAIRKWKSMSPMARAKAMPGG